MSPGGESKGIAFFQQWESNSGAASSSCCSPWAALASFPGHRVENAAFLHNCSSSGFSWWLPQRVPQWAGELGGDWQPRGTEQGEIASICPPGYDIPAGTAPGDHPGAITRRYHPLLPPVLLSTGKITNAMSWGDSQICLKPGCALKQNAHRQKKRECFKMILEDFWKFSLTCLCFYNFFKGSIRLKGKREVVFLWLGASV